MVLWSLGVPELKPVWSLCTPEGFSFPFAHTLDILIKILLRSRTIVLLSTGLRPGTWDPAGGQILFLGHSLYTHP